MAAMRRRRYNRARGGGEEAEDEEKKAEPAEEEEEEAGPAAVDEAEVVVADGADACPPPEEKEEAPAEEDSPPAPEPVLSEEAEESPQARDEANEADAGPTPPGAPSEDGAQPSPPSSSERSYMGVARMRRLRLREQKAARLRSIADSEVLSSGSAGAGDDVGVEREIRAEVASMSVTASMVRDGSGVVDAAAVATGKEEEGRVVARPAPPAGASRPAHPHGGPPLPRGARPGHAAPPPGPRPSTGDRRADG
ncbi:hypothetical protein THAOC_20395, partial [Thalassiosira oceanica]